MSLSLSGMRSLLVSVVLFTTAVVAPPPNRGAQQPPPPEAATEAPQRPLYEFTYQKYLEEIVKTLETDPVFNEKLRGMPEEDIKAGKIADAVDALPDPIQQRLHTLKMAELERLREQIQKQVEADGGSHNVKLPEHLDLQNWEKFNKEDLRLLIKKTVADMDEMDKNRHQEFKDYELKKKAEEDHKLAQLSPEERQKAIHEAEEKQKRHNEHEKLKHPGSRDQLEEVWEDSDQMAKDSFDPRTFFALHDLNGDGFWNSEELEALFQIELDKMYNETNPDDDPQEKMEEMFRMREHVVKQMDKNQDRLISLDEFLQDSEAQTANKDPGWEDLGQELEHNQLYTEEELKKFEEEYAKQMGWGDDAYRPMDGPPPPGQPPIDPYQVNRGGVPDPNYHQPAPAQPPSPPQYQQPGQQQHNQPPPPPPPVQQQQQQYQQPRQVEPVLQQQQQQQQQYQQPAAQPAQQQQQQPPQQQQQQQPVPVQPHVPIQDAPKDPTYGI